MKYLSKSPALPECRPCQPRFCLDRQIAAKARRPQRSNRGEEQLSTPVFALTRHAKASSATMDAINLGTSLLAESCIASATISTDRVSPRTAERPLCRLVQRRACARSALSAKITSRGSGCSVSPAKVRYVSLPVACLRLRGRRKFSPDRRRQREWRRRSKRRCRYRPADAVAAAIFPGGIV